MWAGIHESYTSRWNSGDAGAIGYAVPDILMTLFGSKRADELVNAGAKLTSAAAKNR